MGLGEGYLLKQRDKDWDRAASLPQLEGTSFSWTFSVRKLCPQAGQVPWGRDVCLAATTCLRRSWELHQLLVGCAWVKQRLHRHLGLWTMSQCHMERQEVLSQLLREKPEGSPGTSPSCWSVQPGRSGHPVQGDILSLTTATPGQLKCPGNAFWMPYG